MNPYFSIVTTATDGTVYTALFDRDGRSSQAVKHVVERPDGTVEEWPSQ